LWREKSSPNRKNLFVRHVIPLFDVNNDGKLQWFEVWTGLSIWVYSVSLFVALAFLFASGAPATHFIQLGGGMVLAHRPHTQTDQV